ncbi:MAG: EamA family transporter [Candidatus Kariarchaeaceae archaeon]
MRGKTPVSLGLVYRSIPAIPFILISSTVFFGFSSISIYFEVKILILLFLTSLMLTLGDYFLMYGLRKYSIRAVISATSINPIITMIWLVGSGIERITAIIVVGTVITILGVAIVTLQQDERKDDQSNPLYGVLIGLTVAILFGSMIYIDVYLLSTLDTNGYTYNGMKIVGPGGLGLFFYILLPKYRESYAKEERAAKWRSFKYLFLSGIVGWVIGASLMFYTIDQVGAAIPIPIINIHPMLAVIFTAFLGIEKLNRYHGLGILAVVVGTFVLAV